MTQAASGNPSGVRIEVSSDLSTVEFAGASATLVPSDIYYMAEAAQTFSVQGGATWYITSPGQGMLLAANPTIEWKVEISDLPLVSRRQQAHFPGYHNGVESRGQNMTMRVCPRQGNCITNAMMICNVIINGQSLDVEPYKYNTIFDRVYSTKREASTKFSRSGGEMDTGSCRFILPQDMDVYGLSVATRLSTQRFRIMSNPNGLVGVNKTREPLVWDCGAVQTAYAQVGGVIQHDYEQTSNNGNLGNSSLVNWGLYKRRQRFYNYIMEYCNSSKHNRVPGYALGITQDAEELFPGTLTKSFYEPIPCPPFVQYDARDKQKVIPHVENLVVQCRFNSDRFTQNILQAVNVPLLCGPNYQNVVEEDNGIITNNTVLHYSGQFALATDLTPNPSVQFTNPATNLKALRVILKAAPILRMKWLQPPMNMQLNSIVRLPTTRITNFEKNIELQVGDVVKEMGGFDAAGSISKHQIVYSGHTLDESSNNGLHREYTVSNSHIRLETMFDRCYLTIKRDPTQAELWHPTDHFCGITGVQINIDGKSGRLIRANPYQLYEISMKYYVEPVPFEFWFYRSCIFVFTAADLGVHAGPGFNRPVTMHIDVTYVNTLSIPSTTGFCIPKVIGRALYGAHDSGVSPFYDAAPHPDYSIDNYSAISFNDDTVFVQEIARYVMQVTCEYVRYVLSLGEDGKSDLRMVTV